MQTYSDLDLNFYRHPGSGDVSRIFNLDAIKNAIFNILNGKPFEKPFDEFYGTAVRELLFSLYSPMTPIIVKRILKEKLELYEPRITIDSVVVNRGTEAGNNFNMDRNSLTVDVVYTVKEYGTQTLQIEMERLR